jgi:hypothetical protein
MLSTIDLQNFHDMVGAKPKHVNVTHLCDSLARLAQPFAIGQGAGVQWRLGADEVVRGRAMVTHEQLASVACAEGVVLGMSQRF